ncbi:MAG: hypothetical protein ACD_73C00415G0002 [uncultured bacterium]|nr:MAG: hypothetical protein ACD_73C00415G0002 [uncultured bacterium]
MLTFLSSEYLPRVALSSKLMKVVALVSSPLYTAFFITILGRSELSRPSVVRARRGQLVKLKESSSLRALIYIGKLSLKYRPNTFDFEKSLKSILLLTGNPKLSVIKLVVSLLPKIKKVPSGFC